MPSTRTFSSLCPRRGGPRPRGRRATAHPWRVPLGSHLQPIPRANAAQEGEPGRLWGARDSQVPTSSCSQGEAPRSSQIPFLSLWLARWPGTGGSFFAECAEPFVRQGKALRGCPPFVQTSVLTLASRPCPLLFSFPTPAFSAPLRSPVWPSLPTLLPALRTQISAGFRMAKKPRPWRRSRLGANGSQCVACGQVARLSGPPPSVRPGF